MPSVEIPKNKQAAGNRMRAKVFLFSSFISGLFSAASAFGNVKVSQPKAIIQSETINV
jgi:hypothetical protein